MSYDSYGISHGVWLMRLKVEFLPVKFYNAANTGVIWHFEYKMYINYTDSLSKKMIKSFKVQPIIGY